MRRLSSQRTASASRSASSTRSVTSRRLPIGVAHTTSGNASHRSPSSASKPTRAAPTSPASSPNSAWTTRSDSSAGSSASRRAASTAGSRRRSHAASPKPPPTTTTSGAKTLRTSRSRGQGSGRSAPRRRAPGHRRRVPRGRAGARRPRHPELAAARSAASPDATASRWPRPWQLPWHGGPSASTTTCPSSAQPRYRRPSSTTPPPTPVPSVEGDEVATPRPAPSRHSASAIALPSFSSPTGMPKRSWRRRASSSDSRRAG